MRKCLIFCHGWGGTVNFWNNLRKILDLKLSHDNLNVLTFFLDLGYFGDPIDSLPASLLDNQDLEFIGVGHSLGLIKLLELNIKFKALIGLQGFINFLGTDLELRKIRSKQLKALIKKFSFDPVVTLQDFYQFVSANIPLYKYQLKLDLVRLREDLELLTKDFRLMPNLPVLIIGADNDPIVPPVLIFDNFIKHELVTIKILPAGSHGLGCKNPEIVYHELVNFLHAINN